MQDMYTVMIVDDEKAIRDSLPAVINFEMYGFRVCQTARNGQDALEKINRSIQMYCFSIFVCQF